MYPNRYIDVTIEQTQLHFTFPLQYNNECIINKIIEIPILHVKNSKPIISELCFNVNGKNGKYTILVLYLTSQFVNNGCNKYSVKTFTTPKKARDI